MLPEDTVLPEDAMLPEDTVLPADAMLPDKLSVASINDCRNREGAGEDAHAAATRRGGCYATAAIGPVGTGESTSTAPSGSTASSSTIVASAGHR